jgi:glutamyl-tRNA reductase
MYAAPAQTGRPLTDTTEALFELIAQTADVPADTLRPHAYRVTDLAAVRRLCRVAAGLDSMVLGESEILGQVVAAHRTATDAGAVGPVLKAAFRAATRAGRRARAETGISKLPTSVSTEAIRLLTDVAGPLDRLAVLIIGTGKMGRGAARALRAQVRTLTVISRTAEHAEELASDCDATALGWHDLPRAIGAADAIICSTGAPHAVVSRELMARVIADDGERRHVFVDIAVPRDVEPAVRELPGVELYDLDTLQVRLDGNLEARRQEVPAVEQIVDQEVAHFDAWRHDMFVRPLLLQIRAQGETIRQRELARALRHLGPVPPEFADMLETFSQSLVNKILHEPSRRLREADDMDRTRGYLDVTRDLFGLDAPDAAAGGSAV